jgi:hypothetical protein
VASAIRFMLIVTTALTAVPSVPHAIALTFQDPPEFHDIKNYGLGSHRTVVIAFGSKCEPCKNSVPFYKQLLTVMDSERTRMIVLSTDGVVPVHKVLVAAELKPHRLVSYPRMSKLREISDDAPELTVLDASGKSLGTWRGRLSALEEAEVLKLIGE